MIRRRIYEKYHSGLKYQKRIISDKDFTYRNILKELKPFVRKRMSILDIGSGSGTLSYYLASKKNQVLGVDISKKAVNLANENAKFLNLNNSVRFLFSDFPNKKISQHFDLILLVEVVEHTPNDMITLAEAFKLLKKGGLLFISVPSKSAPLYRWGLLNTFDKEVGHLRRYSEEDLVRLVKKSKLSILRIASYEGILRNMLYTNRLLGVFLKFVKGPISDSVSIIDNLLVKIFGPSQIVLIAIKK